MAKELSLFDSDFQTARPANPLFCHADFLEKLGQYANQAIGKRAALLLQRLVIDERRLHYKSTHGLNRGWRRSRLGGAGGSHFYAWWAPSTAAPFRDDAGFAQAPDRALFVRDIRHHDDHSLLTPQSFLADYLPISVPDLRREVFSPAPWTPQQHRFATARSPVRILKGHPGSGKTTALLHAADATPGRHVLYLTYSSDLAALAREHFDRYCSSARTFHVLTYSSFLRQLLRSAPPSISESELVKSFQRDLSPYQRSLGVWADNLPALFDELHAHLAGDALPVEVGRFAACTHARVPDKQYRERRSRFLGLTATFQAIDAANRLEKAGPGSLAERYFPELALAWNAATALCGGSPSGILPELLDFDCIAVDECQDLTPLESFVIAQLAVCIHRKHGLPIPVLLAGDEAQTVRPTDFEWGWLNDLFHTLVGTPTEFKLTANLRSPRRIATLVNHVWDLYSHLEKKDRPSGTGLAEIEDDATDQIFYCTAAPGPDLDALLTDLTSREGMALIAFGEIPTALPESIRRSVLLPSEAKGLDFHSVCVIGAGPQLERITKLNDRYRADSDIEGLRKRLAIDQLRVALSRPTERLFWLDISPAEKTVRNSLRFLNGQRFVGGLSATSPAAILKTLHEESLDLEERIQRCQADARQFLSVRPDLAWSRAQQAVALLGDEGATAAITDGTTRRTAYLTLAEICFTLALRDAHLSPELGRPDLFEESRRAAHGANRSTLSILIVAISRAHRAAPPDRLTAFCDLAQTLPRYRPDLEPWILVEIGPRVQTWLAVLEHAISVGDNAAILTRILPPFYDALGLPDAEARTARLRTRALELLLKARSYGEALEVISEFPTPQPRQQAVCYEGLGDFAKAAESYRAAGDLESALNCYRAVPDFPATLALIRELGKNHPAAPSLEWLERIQAVIAERPDNFTRVMKPSEKKLLESLLEQALGATRRKPAAAKKTAPAKKAARKPKPPKHRDLF